MSWVSPPLPLPNVGLIGHAGRMRDLKRETGKYNLLLKLALLSAVLAASPSKEALKDSISALV